MKKKKRKTRRPVLHAGDLVRVNRNVAKTYSQLAGKQGRILSMTFGGPYWAVRIRGEQYSLFRHELTLVTRAAR